MPADHGAGARQLRDAAQAQTEAPRAPDGGDGGVVGGRAEPAPVQPQDLVANLGILYKIYNFI